MISDQARSFVESEHSKDDGLHHAERTTGSQISHSQETADLPLRPNESIQATTQHTSIPSSTLRSSCNSQSTESSNAQSTESSNSQSTDSSNSQSNQSSIQTTIWSRIGSKLEIIGLLATIITIPLTIISTQAAVASLTVARWTQSKDELEWCIDVRTTYSYCDRKLTWP